MKVDPIISQYMAKLGRRGGPARAASLSKRRRIEIARLGGITSSVRKAQKRKKKAA